MRYSKYLRELLYDCLKKFLIHISWLFHVVQISKRSQEKKKFYVNSLPIHYHCDWCHLQEAIHSNLSYASLH